MAKDEIQMSTIGEETDDSPLDLTSSTEPTQTHYTSSDYYCLGPVRTRIWMFFESPTSSKPV